MIGLAHGIKVYLCTTPADMRRGFDGLSSMAQSLLKQDLLSGHLFVFRNRNRDKLKILYWDQDGLAIWYKRLEQGTFQFPTDGKAKDKVATAKLFYKLRSNFSKSNGLVAKSLRADAMPLMFEKKKDQLSRIIDGFFDCFNDFIDH